MQVGFYVLTAVVMKNSLLCNITACSPLKINRHFGRICRLHLRGRRINQAALAKCFILVSCLAYFWPSTWRRHVCPKCLLTFKRLRRCAPEDRTNKVQCLISRSRLFDPQTGTVRCLLLVTARVYGRQADRSPRTPEAGNFNMPDV
jgi:hypothetical protein